VFTFTK